MHWGPSQWVSTTLTGGHERGWLTNLLIAQFENRVIRWSPDGKGVALLGRDTFCCAFEVTNADDE